MINSIVIIPARGGSKGLRRKNLIEIGGKSLTLRSMIHARSIAKDSEIILSTDSLEIMNSVAKYFSFEKFIPETNKITDFGPFKLHFRDQSLASDTALITNVLYSTRSLLLDLNCKVDLICLLQPTTPFRSQKELLKVKNIIKTQGTRNISLVSVRTVDDGHPARMYTMSSNTHLSELEGFQEFRAARRQDLPKLFIRDGGYYLIGDELVSKKLQYSKEPMSLKREFPWSINIDGQSDLILAQNVNKEILSEDPNGLI